MTPTVIEDYGSVSNWECFGVKKKRSLAPPAAPRAFSYLRFSTRDQMKGDSLRRQVAAVKAMAQRDGFVLDEELTFQDLGVSAHHGQNFEVGALGRFLELVRDGTIPRGSRLYVESLDRISRQTVRRAIHTMASLVEEGITVVDVMDGGRVYNMQTLDNDDLAFLMMILRFIRSHEESVTKGERGAASWDAKRKKVIRMGKCDKPYTRNMPSWIRWNDGAARYELIPRRAALVRKVFQMADKGWKEEGIAGWLNKSGVPLWERSGRIGRRWYYTYIREMLRTPLAIGTFTPHLFSHRDPRKAPLRTPLAPIPKMYPAAVDIDLFRRVQARMQWAAQAQAKARVTGRKSPPKYRGSNGELWVGYGWQPQWIREALKGGASLDDFAIGGKTFSVRTSPVRMRIR